jgi:hypothetical protein
MRSAQDAAVRGGDGKNRKLQISGTDDFSNSAVDLAAREHRDRKEKNGASLSPKFMLHGQVNPLFYVFFAFFRGYSDFRELNFS